MIYSAREFEHYSIHARDGVLGTVKDLFFDDQSWLVRYFVVETGSWLNGRQVLLSAPRLSANAAAVRTLSIDATQEQVRNSPPVEADQPVSREQEQAMHDYFGWPYYWGGVPLAGGTLAPLPPFLPSVPIQPDALHAVRGEPGRAGKTSTEHRDADPHLQSMRHVHGYEIAARDGSLGKVHDFLLDDSMWKIRHIVVDTHKFLPGRKVLVAPDWIESIHSQTSEIAINLSREEIRHGPEYDPTHPITEEYTDRLYQHYGRTRRNPETDSSNISK